MPHLRANQSQAAAVLAFPNAFGLTVRYAMKASPNAALLKIFADCGLHFDASSGWECDRAMNSGIAPEKISQNCSGSRNCIWLLATLGLIFHGVMEAIQTYLLEKTH